MKVKRGIAWLLSFLMVFSLIMGISKMQVYALGATYTVDFGTGSWTVGDVTVSADKSGTLENFAEETVITLTGFNAESMEVRLSASEGFHTTLTVDENGQTSLSAKNCEGLPNDTLTFSVVAKSSGDGGNGGGSGSDEGGSGDLKNPKTIVVNITAGSEYLDTFGSYLKVDGVVVENNSVTVEQAETHVISVLPQFGYTISAKINETAVSGTEVEGWVTYTVNEADTYNIAISVAGSSVCTIIWDYVGDYGTDAIVSNGTVKIISAILPDGSNGIGDINTQNEEGGHVVIEPGSTVTVEIKPDYGYQFVAGSLNGETITAGTEVSRFTFTMPSTNLHLSALFTATEDIINTDSTQVESGSIGNGSNVIDSGNLKLEIGDLSQTEIDAIDDEMKQTAGDDEIQLYLDMNLYSVVNKGTQNDAWENQLTDLNGELSVTLELSDALKGTDGTFYVIREHDEADGSKTYTKIKATYDKEAGTITFVTNKFSTYALVLESEVSFSDITTSDKNACNAGLTELTDNLIRKLLTDTEKGRLENGEEVKVWLEATDISASVSKTDKDLIDSKKGNAAIGIYLDINLFKQIGTDASSNITETNDAVKITLKVPDTLINSNTSVKRTYQLIRVHNGAVTIIPCTYDAATATISAETNQFSTYALAYVDQQVIPEKGDVSNPYAWFLLALACGIGALYFGKRCSA